MTRLTNSTQFGAHVDCGTMPFYINGHLYHTLLRGGGQTLMTILCIPTIAIVVVIEFSIIISI
jgi:hypothetical protein